MEYLQGLLETYNLPVLTVFILGLMTSISPCPLATNITATAYISKNIKSKKKVLLSGILYSLGRGVSYTGIGLILYFGASKFHIARFLNQNGEKFLGPLLIIIGFIMLDLVTLKFLNKLDLQRLFSDKFRDKGIMGSFILGLVFALAFCPYSGALYFGMVVPMTITDGLYLPIVFALGTAIPVILFTYLLAFAAGNIGLVFNKITEIEKGMRKIIAVVFILVGLYYLYLFFT